MSTQYGPKYSDSKFLFIFHFPDNTKRVANKIRESLKTQQDNNEKNKKETSKLSSREQTDQRLRITQVASQTKRFSEVWSSYNESQLEFRKKSKATLIKAAKITGSTNLTDDKIEEMIDEGHTDGLFGGNLHATVQAEKDKLLALQSRHGEFMKASDFKHVMFFKWVEIFNNIKKLIHKKITFHVAHKEYVSHFHMNI